MRNYFIRKPQQYQATSASACACPLPNPFALPQFHSSPTQYHGRQRQCCFCVGWSASFGSGPESASRTVCATIGVATMQDEKCSVCRRHLPIKDFPRLRRDTYCRSPRCSQCVRKANRAASDAYCKRAMAKRRMGHVDGIVIEDNGRVRVRQSRSLLKAYIGTRE